MQLDRSYDELPSALVAGRLQGIGVPDLLWTLCRSGATGVLRITRCDIEKAVYVEEGRIVFATSSDPDDRLGEMFLRRGLVSIDQLDQAISGLSSGKRLGTLLVEAGHLDPDALVHGVLDQVEEIVLDLFEWEDGDYHFEQGALPTDELIKLGMKTGELLLRGIRQLRAFSRIRRSVGALQKVYGVTESWKELLEGVSLTPAERSLVDRLAEGDASLEELCREVFLSNFEIYQTMWALRVLGAVERRDEPWMAPSEMTQRGSLDQVDFTELLVRLGRGGETGVLYVTRDHHERTFHIANGRCVFATSNDPDDGLLAYLLRRGVISLHDREETAKRLLSNKRVGAILRELGVIEERDLAQVVREQLSDVVYDTFRWTDAEYSFVPGPLPTVEEITLEEDLDALVARGIRRVTSWSRVWQGCGGLDVTLELKPTYLSVLDAMGAGPEEWEVIAALKTPRTPRQICRGLRFGDFRVCQILWAMRVLGGVEAVAAEEEETVPEVQDAVDAGTITAPALDVAPPSEVRPLPEDRALEQSIVTMEGSLADDPTPSPVSWSVAADPADGPAVADPVPEPELATAPTPDETATPAPPAIEVPEAWKRPAEDLAGQDSATPGEATGTDSAPPAIDVPEDWNQPAEDLAEQGAATPGETTEPDSAPTMEWADSADPSSNSVEESDEVVESPPAATQAIPPGMLEAALHGDSHEQGPGEATDVEPPPEATQVIPRELIEAAVAGAGVGDEQAAPLAEAASEDTTSPAVEDAESPEADDDWSTPEDLDEAISRFNAAQRVVYRTVRAEVGAGAFNFIRSCCTQGTGEESDAVAGVELRPDGSWDPAGLRTAARVARLDDPWVRYQRVIDGEIERLRQFIGDNRAVELQRQVELVERSDATR